MKISHKRYFRDFVYNRSTEALEGGGGGEEECSLFVKVYIYF